MPNTTQLGTHYLQEPVKGVSVIIPCKNEEKAIRFTVDELQKVMDCLDLDYEIIVVDDGSTDATRDEALAAGARVLVHNINLGYGNAILDGMLCAKYAVIAIIDADGTYPVTMLPALIAKSTSHDMVIGARSWSRDNTTVLGRIMRKMLYYIILYFSQHRAPDYNSGLRVFHKLDVLNYRPILCPTFSFTTSLTLLYLLLSRSVAFVPITYSKRIGKSKVSHFRDAVRTFSYVFVLVSLFQPYRLSLMMVFLGMILNGLVLGARLLLGFDQGIQVGLHIAVSLAILLSEVALGVYPISKLYLSDLSGHPEK